MYIYIHKSIKKNKYIYTYIHMMPLALSGPKRWLSSIRDCIPAGPPRQHAKCFGCAGPPNGSGS